MQEIDAPPRTDAERDLWALAATVADPEIPVLTIEDLGILREVRVSDAGVLVVITPTYSGCPAMDTIRDDLTLLLNATGHRHITVELRLSPAWTTDWMTEAGKAKLATYGIAAPTGHAATGGPIRVRMAVPCPRCHSLATREISRFGSTSCKALYECTECLEPFDYFKIL